MVKSESRDLVTRLALAEGVTSTGDAVNAGRPSIDGGLALHNVNQVTVRQVLPPDRMRARVTAVIRVLGFGAVPVGTVIGGVIAEIGGIRIALVVSGIGLVAGSLPYILVHADRLRSVTDLTPANAAASG